MIYHDLINMYISIKHYLNFKFQNVPSLKLHRAVRRGAHIPPTALYIINYAPPPPPNFGILDAMERHTHAHKIVTLR
jgi:hypothetical protein